MREARLKSADFVLSLPTPTPIYGETRVSLCSFERAPEKGAAKTMRRPRADGDTFGAVFPVADARLILLVARAPSW